MTAKRRGRGGWILGLFAIALSTSACSTYSYFNLDLKLGTGFNTVEIGLIEVCHVYVTGAATDDFTINSDKCHLTNPDTGGDVGNIEYSTFADSGNLNFELRVFQRPESDPTCKLGSGTTTLAIDSGKTVTGTVTATATGMGCHM